jgi:2,3-bisphosphoglycerate-independent phosphoglycerate mutase
MNKKIESIKGKKTNLPLILIILDGWGIAPSNKGNAISLAKTSYINDLAAKYPSSSLFAAGEYVGLPKDQVGNSEAGHMNIGAGRVVEQDAVRINNSIKDGTFFKNTAFLQAINHSKKNNSNLHLIGLLSGDSSPHSDPKHIVALLNLFNRHKNKNVFLHLFTDGRDSPRYASLKLVEELQKNFFSNEQIASIIGRFYAMDRKKSWDRTEMAYNALVSGIGRFAPNAPSAITEAYNRGESDEFIEPYIIYQDNKPTARINDGDSIIFINLRSDRARQLAKAFMQKNFSQNNEDSFKRKKTLSNICFVAMTDFGPELDEVLTAYPSIDVKQTLPMQVKDLRQLYISETEKYAHVTYFFNGGYMGKVDDEDHVCLPSPDVKFYDEVPGMSTEDLTDQINKFLKTDKYDFYVLNFAAPDMIGHTGNLKAAIECCQIVDKNLEEIVNNFLKKNGTVMITADHGNIEKMINLETGEIYTEHTDNKVPFILVNDQLKNLIRLKNGSLSDIAPTILDFLGIKKPAEMTGKSLIEFKK